MTIRDHVAEAVRQMDHAGIEGASREAWLLLAAVLNQDRATLLAHALEALSPGDQRTYFQLVERRIDREPFAQILGEKEFWSLPFSISRDVLCPRPDSETLVDLAIALLKGRTQTSDGPLRILDLGTGSGCLVLALLHELPKAIAVAVDRSAKALAISRANGERLGLSRRVSWLCADWGTALEGSFELIVSNPPYIETCEWANLAPEITKYEPKSALLAGRDGLDAYRQLAPDVARLLAPGGLACFEHGLGQAEDVLWIMEKAGLQHLASRRDLAGIERCLAVRSPG